MATDAPPTATPRPRSGARGTFWFYSGDVPYFHFEVGKVNFYVDFKTVDYHKPLDDCPRTEDGKELEGDDKEEFAYLIPMMKYKRNLVFHIPDQPDKALNLYINSEKYYLEYGSSQHGRVAIDISATKVEALVNALDAAFERGKHDADGDFTQREDRLVSNGIDSYLYFRASTWTYERTEHEPEDGALSQCQFVAVTLGGDGPIEVTVDPNSSSYAPWKKFPPDP